MAKRMEQQQKNLKQSQSPSDNAFLNEMSLELVNGASRIVDYEVDRAHVKMVVDRFVRLEKAGLFNSRED